MSGSRNEVDDQWDPNGLRALQTRIVGLELELDDLREQQARRSFVLDSAKGYAIISLDVSGCVTGWDGGARAIMGYDEADILGRSGEIFYTAADRSIGRFEAEMASAIGAGHATNERWHLRRDGTQFWASGVMMPLLDANEVACGFLSVLRDRTAAQAAAERRDLLLGEMVHRTANTLTLAQALAAMTRRHTETIADFDEAFGVRLGVLARSNDLLTRSDWHDAPLHDVIENALATFRNDKPDRIDLAGPQVLLNGGSVVTVGLVFHELATNAVKYGALSAPTGHVEISWSARRVRDATRVDLVWRERGGPRVRPPSRQGFGTQLLAKGISGSATVELKFAPEGLQCDISLLAARVPVS